MKNVVIGVLIVVVMGCVFYWTYSDDDRIDQNLAESVLSSLSRESEIFQDLEVAVKGRQVTLRGQLSSQEQLEKALFIAQTTVGVESVENRLTLSRATSVKSVISDDQKRNNSTEINSSSANSLAESTEQPIQNYQTGIQLDQNRLVLHGSVPNTPSKKSLHEAAQVRFPEHEIVDRLSIQSGEPSNWLNAMEKLIQHMQPLIRGHAVILNQTIALSGDVDSQDKVDHATTALKSSLSEDFQFNPRIKVVHSYKDLESLKAVRGKVQ